MKYNFENIGKRIAKERKEYCHLSQDGLLTKLSEKYGIGMCRNTLSAIEKGKYQHYDIDFLFALCELFNCEIGYLLCEYDCKTGRETDIVESTGLSITSVQRITKSHPGDKNNELDMIISSNEYYKLIRQIQIIMDNYNLIFECIEKMGETEEMAIGVNTDSDKYRKLGDIWDSYLTKTGRCEREIDAAAYQCGIAFGNIINNFKDNLSSQVKSAYEKVPSYQQTEK